jgi:G:T-mismatch repair DNA endonuclease (very short patch repair protein)
VLEIYKKGHSGYWAGKTFSDEHRKKISESNKGKKNSKETRRRISIALRGKPHPHKGSPLTKETKQKISNSKRGRPLSLNHRQKISEGNKGKRFSEEHKQKIALARIGKTHSEATKQRLREARLKYVIPKKDTTIEVALQEELNKNNIKYETHIPVCGICQPDIVFPLEKVAVFADGDYWHSKEFDNGNIWRKDRQQEKTLKENEWVVLRFWGSEIRNNLQKCINEILFVLGSQNRKPQK